MDKDSPIQGSGDDHAPSLEALAADSKKLLDGDPVEYGERGDRDRCIDIQAFREIMYALHTVSIGTHQLLYFSSMKYAKTYLDTDATTLEQAVEQLATIFDAQNIGTLTLAEHDDGEDATITLAENALTIDADTDKPICYFISGYIAGYLENAIGDHYVVNETSCTSQGNDHCTFRARKR
jgi:predicted hydrocarbon binding protein